MSFIAIPKEYINKVTKEYTLVTVVQDYLKDLYGFINQYKNVWNWHVVDFYLNDVWYNEDIIPSSWRILKDCSLNEILRMTSLHEIKVNYD